MALSVNRLINVSLSISPLAAANRGFGTLLVIGDSDVISASERYRSYMTINEVAKDFGVESPEYKAAELYFAQEPAPSSIMIGKWNRAASQSELTGGILTAEEQSLSNWTNIVNGTFAYRLNNVVKPIEGLNFEGRTNMNGIAEVINSKINDALLEWTGERFVLRSLGTGSNQELGYLEPVAPQSNVHEMLGLSAGLATMTSGTDYIPGYPEIPASSGELKGAEFSGELNALKQITEGSFKVNIDGEQVSLTYLDFSSAQSLEEIATVISDNLGDKGICSYEAPSFIIRSASTGASSAVTNAIAGEITTPAIEATAGKLTGTALGELDTLKLITDGSFKLNVDSEELSLEEFNFSSVNSFDEIAAAIQAKLQGKATVIYDTDHFVITSNSTGVSSVIQAAQEGNKTHPDQLATSGKFIGAAITEEGFLETAQLISNATLKITVDGGSEQTTQQITLSAAEDIEDIARLIEAAITEANANVIYDAEKKQFIFSSKTTGSTSSITVAAGTGNLFTTLMLDSGEAQAGANAVTGTDNQLHTKLGLAAGASVPGQAAVLANDNQVHNKLGLDSGVPVSGTDLVPEVPAIEATAGKLTGGMHASLTTLKGIQDGNFSISIDGAVPQILEELDFSKIETLEDVAIVIGSNLSNATCAAVGDRLVITSARTGVISNVGFAQPVELNEFDISSQLKLSKDTALKPVPGFDAESPLQAAQILSDRTSDWYGCTFASNDMPTDEQLVDVAKYIESNTQSTHIFGITATDTRVLDRVYTDDIASRCKELGLNRTVVQYSQNPYAICSFLGRAFTVNFNGNMTTITLMYKQEPMVEAEELTETQAVTLEEKRCNVFVKYNNGSTIIQYGVMSGDFWFDERHGADWLQNYVQTAVWNLLYTSTTKIGQDDAGINTIVGVINDCLVQARNNGFIGAGIWNGDGFGQLQRGAMLDSGFYVYAPPMSTQNQAEREARISVPIQVAAKLLGAIHSIDVSITLNR